MNQHSPQPSNAGRPLRLLLTSGAVTLAAWLVRLIHLNHLGISHRDDNVYVLAARMLLTGDWTDFFDRLPVHAPPLYPLSVWVAFRWLGDHDGVAIMVSALWGAATVGLVFHALKRWAGWTAAWSGAAILAFSPLHLAYSRIALTDTAFAFFYMAGFVIAADRLLGERTPRRLWLSGAALGVVSALGMYAKYQGLMILVSGLFFELLALVLTASARRWRLPLPHLGQDPPPIQARWAHALGSLALAAAICGLAWLPYRLYLDHRFGVDLMHQQHLLFATPWRQIPFKAPEKLLILGVAAWLWMKGAGLLAAAGVARGCVHVGRSPRWLWLAVGWGLAYGAALMTYTPFVRLVLPLAPLLAIAGAWAGDGLAGSIRREHGARRVLSLAGMLLIGFYLLGEAHGALGWRSDGYRKLSVQIAQGKIGGVRIGSAPLVMGVDYSLLYYLPASKPGQLWLETFDPAPLGRHFYVLVDYVAYTKPVSQGWLRRWKDDMKRVAVIPNPRLAPTVFNPPYRSSLTYMVGHQPVPERLADFQLYEVNLPPGEH